MGGYWDRFHKYMNGGPEAIDGWPPLIPAAEFNKAVAATLGAALEREGFQQTAPRRRVRSLVAAIRQSLALWR